MFYTLRNWKPGKVLLQVEKKKQKQKQKGKQARVGGVYLHNKK